VASKLRAIYQRSKGRDLFDIWLALTHLGADSNEVLGAFGPYRPDNYSSQLAIDNLDAKLMSTTFRVDLNRMTAIVPDDYDIDEAAALLKEQLLSKV
jgi:hypothetical protein